MKDCSPNNRFNCSPYVKYLFILFVLGLALYSCSQDVRVDDNIDFNSTMLVVENNSDIKLIDKLTAKLLKSDVWGNNSNKISSKISDIHKYQNELYFYLADENLIKVYENSSFDFITEYDFKDKGAIGDIAFPNISNFYVSLTNSNEVLIVDRVNQKISSYSVAVDSKPTKLLSIDNLLFVACENSISVIRTGSNQVEHTINLGEATPLFLANNTDKSTLIVVTSEQGSNYLEYYNISSMEQIKKVQLKIDNLKDGETIIPNCFSQTNSTLEYGWLGTNVGLFRIDLRNFGTYNYASTRVENILDIYFEPLSNNLLLLSARNELRDYVLADPKNGEYIKTLAMSNNTNKIFPI